MAIATTSKVKVWYLRRVPSTRGCRLIGVYVGCFTDLKEIQRLIREGKYEFSFHAQQESLEENLDIREIEEAVVSHGEILEDYPDDPRGESCLILGFAGTHPIHAVVGWATRRRDGQKVLRVITVYRPTSPKWTDPRTRGGRP